MPFCIVSGEVSRKILERARIDLLPIPIRVYIVYEAKPTRLCSRTFCGLDNIQHDMDRRAAEWAIAGCGSKDMSKKR